MNSRDALETVKSQLEAAYAKADVQYKAMPSGRDEAAIFTALYLVEEAIANLSARMKEWQDEPTPVERLTVYRNAGHWPDQNERSDV